MSEMEREVGEWGEEEKERENKERKRDGVNESVNENDIQPQTQHNRLFFV